MAVGRTDISEGGFTQAWMISGNVCDYKMSMEMTS
jgi:hypothetical protein